jgi:hypothetical protein
MTTVDTITAPLNSRQSHTSSIHSTNTSVTCVLEFPMAATITQSQDFSSLKVNGSRLMSTIHDTAEFGKAHVWGK